jgi:hypothetical protein
MTDPHPQRIDVVLIASGKYHDIDFARLELLKLLAENECHRVRVFEDYTQLDAIRQARFLVTYTCDVIPSLEQQEALRAWVEGGGRWLCTAPIPSCASSPMAWSIRRPGRRT